MKINEICWELAKALFIYQEIWGETFYSTPDGLPSPNRYFNISNISSMWISDAINDQLLEDFGMQE